MSFHRPGKASRQGSHFKFGNPHSNCKTLGAGRDIRENHNSYSVCGSRAKCSRQPNWSKMCSWPPGSQNCSRWGLWCRFSFRFSVDPKIFFYYVPKLHHETMILRGLVRERLSLHKPSQATRQGSHSKLRNAVPNCKIPEV